MNLPETLKNGIESETENFDFRDISEAREELTEKYRQRQPKKQNFITTKAERCAYVAARMPATYAVIHHVLREISARCPEINIKSLLDLGAGPGTAMWATCDIYNEIEKITLIEKDNELALLGKRLATYSEKPAVKNALWQSSDLELIKEFPPHDLITLSYSIGELSPEAIPPLVEACWNATNQLLVIIEPGTPAGFERIRTIREQLISLKANMVAPCPHASTCPMKGNDWCHFSERIERSSLHRRIKGGSLGYEDEKFSYLIFSKHPTQLPDARILRHPLKRSGHVVLTLCTRENITQETISKKTPDAYKQARKLEWGSVYTNPK